MVFVLNSPVEETVGYFFRQLVLCHSKRPLNTSDPTFNWPFLYIRERESLNPEEWELICVSALKIFLCVFFYVVLLSTNSFLLF